jgi:IS30 family transposase
MSAFAERKARFGDRLRQVFKTITTDNVSEFSACSGLEQAADTLIYYVDNQKF